MQLICVKYNILHVGGWGIGGRGGCGWVSDVCVMFDVRGYEMTMGYTLCVMLFDHEGCFFQNAKKSIYDT